MSLSYQFTSDAQAVYELLTDPDFLGDRSIAIGELSADVTVEEHAAVVNVQMKREVVRELPKFLAKLFDPKQVLHVKESWQGGDGNFSCTSEFTVEGQPVKVSTKVSLKDNDQGCEYRIEYKAKANIPLVGGKVEKFIIANCLEGTQKELEYTAGRLAEIVTA